jgi:DNA-binding GntR family transcriptional regulator
MDTIAQLLFHIRRQTIANASDLAEAIDWHQKIIEAIRKHDPKRAKDMLSGHLRAARDAWVRDNKMEGGGKKADASPTARRRK